MATIETTEPGGGKEHVDDQQERDGSNINQQVVRCPSCDRDTFLLCVYCRNAVPREPAQVYVGKVKNLSILDSELVFSKNPNRGCEAGMLKREGTRVYIQTVECLTMQQKVFQIHIQPSADTTEDTVCVSVLTNKQQLEEVSETMLMLNTDWRGVPEEPYREERRIKEILLTQMIHDESFRFLETILQQINTEDLPTEVIQALYRKFRLRLLGITKGLEVLMEVDAHHLQELLKQVPAITEELNRLVPQPDRDHVTWRDFWHHPVQCEEDTRSVPNLSASLQEDMNNAETLSGALNYACQYGNYLTCQKLLDNPSANIRVIGRHGNTPFHVACLHCQEKLLDLLLGKGAQVNQMDRDGLTPLHLACGAGLKEGKQVEEARRIGTISWLLIHGADPQLKTPQDETAEELAKMAGHYRVVELLQRFHRVA